MVPLRRLKGTNAFKGREETTPTGGRSSTNGKTKQKIQFETTFTSRLNDVLLRFFPCSSSAKRKQCHRSFLCFIASRPKKGEWPLMMVRRKVVNICAEMYVKKGFFLSLLTPDSRWVSREVLWNTYLL